MEENIEEKLKSQLHQLELEQAVFERMVYKNKNQHRRCSYFHYLLKVSISTSYFFIYFLLECDKEGFMFDILILLR